MIAFLLTVLTVAARMAFIYGLAIIALWFIRQAGRAWRDQ